MAKIIQYQLFFPHAPTVVWEYLTKPELTAQWIMPGDIQPIVGHEFTFTTSPKPDLDFDGVFYCKVLEVVPFKKLSYSWKFGPGNGPLNTSEVNWTLEEKDNGTDLLMVHRAFEGATFMPMFTGMSDGWTKLIPKILQLINAAKNGTPA